MLDHLAANSLVIAARLGRSSGNSSVSEDRMPHYVERMQDAGQKIHRLLNDPPGDDVNQFTNSIFRTVLY
ncbi:hypothetical protein TNCT_25921 [Trichonephila clavata]|uniref:Uncharacterized protein n=1 Tax=Trichonephila clavata TaxID=2740835 RepID=A0A8X6FU85_TRICU|nr:hypothetical protein TNCT_25921 [Trichonephila clavata]